MCESGRDKMFNAAGASKYSYSLQFDTGEQHIVFDIWVDGMLSFIDTIRDKGRPFSEEEVRSIVLCFQLFKTLTCMQNEGYCHRDLKPENLASEGRRC